MSRARTTRLLVSVRDEAEALLAAGAGADFIDLKEPRAGALGALPRERIAAVVRRLRESGSRLPISATVGDLPMADVEAIVALVEATAGLGVDYVKVGIEREGGAAVLARLARCDVPIVPVFIVDRGLDEALVEQACGAFPGLMLDTADKRAGSLFARCPEPQLRGFVARVQAAGALAGLAGALRQADLPRLRALAPDFAGFRSAVCADDRTGALMPERVRGLAEALAPEAGRLRAVIGE
ncbi:(5-formylfuran-3-yl)methyl phosphate synthase [Pelomonas sp. KK5]|uniref:(5-formylfuran-3-yl)methyl phosphate synthase n=1 Tax=Pelomonas sp. KK5 TaxID=1855730 RepID=UPI00097C7274|nr:(5-formylfuran-3-yl)methyl phosphate synthase [Pelomonas sp. KK5]